MGKPTFERELKFHVTGLSDLRSRIEELGAERETPSTFEDNVVFDREGELAAAGRLLRLRQDHHGARLTYKGRARFEGQVKVRLEHETTVGSADEIRLLLERLGYRIVARYEKHREEWLLGGVSIALDHTPIGDFAEFEGAGAETVASRCGFDIESAERRAYLRLYHDYLKEHPEAPAQMVFS